MATQRRPLRRPVQSLLVLTVITVGLWKCCRFLDLWHNPLRPWDAGWLEATEHDAPGLATDSVCESYGVPLCATEGIHRETGGALWFVRWDLLTRFDPARGLFSLRLPLEREPYRQRQPSVFHEAADGTVWIGLEDLLVRVEPDSRTFRTFTTHLPGEDRHGLVLSLASTPGGKLWIGTTSGLLVLYNADERPYSLCEALPEPCGGMAAIHPDSSGSDLWLGGTGWIALFDPVAEQVRQVHRFDPDVPNTWPDRRSVLGIYQVPGEGVLWVVTPAAVYRYDPRTGNAQAHPIPAPTPPIRFVPQAQAVWLYGKHDALRFDLENLEYRTFDLGLDSENLTAGTRGEAVWFAARRDFPHSIIRLDPRSRRWTPFEILSDREDRLPRIYQEPDGGPLWVTSGKDAHRLVTGSSPTSKEAGSHVKLGVALGPRLKVPAPQIAVTRRNTLVHTVPGGLVFDSPGREPVVRDLGVHLLDLAAGPGDRVWAAARLGGLLLIGPSGEPLRLTVADGLPSLDVHALAPVPGSSGRVVWAATAGGAVRVAADGDGENGLRIVIERTATVDDGLPSGPVDALAARPDGSVFLAYEALEPHFFDHPELARRRFHGQVRHVPDAGPPGPTLRTPEGEIRGLAVSVEGDRLWLVAENTLFAGSRIYDRQARFEPVQEVRLDSEIRSLTRDPLGRLWLRLDKPKFRQAPVVMFDPSRKTLKPLLAAPYRLGSRDPVDDLAFTATGEAVALRDSELWRGRVPVERIALPTLPQFLALAALLLFVHALVGSLRSTPARKGDRE